jgi:hypothetical protein
MQARNTMETARVRADSRKQLLVYLPPDLIKELKKQAVDDDTTASAIAEEALRQSGKIRSAALAGKRAAE